MRKAIEAIEEFVVRPTHSPQLLRRVRKQTTHSILVHTPAMSSLTVGTIAIDMSSAHPVVHAIAVVAAIPLLIWAIYVLTLVGQLVETIVEQRWWNTEPKASVKAFGYDDSVIIRLIISSQAGPYWQPRIVEQQIFNVDGAWDMIPETVARLEHNRDVINQNMPRIWRQRTTLYASELEEKEVLLLTINDKDHQLNHNTLQQVEPSERVLPFASQRYEPQHYVSYPYAEIFDRTPLPKMPLAIQRDRHGQAKHIAYWVNERTL